MPDFAGMTLFRYNTNQKETLCLLIYQRIVKAALMVPIPLILFQKFRMKLIHKTGIYGIDSDPPRSGGMKGKK